MDFFKDEGYGESMALLVIHRLHPTIQSLFPYNGPLLLTLWKKVQMLSTLLNTNKGVWKCFPLAHQSIYNKYKPTFLG
jgi:hypothetical protein